MNPHLAEVELTIKSCVLSKKGEMTMGDLRKEYFELIGEDIPFKKLGCESLDVLLSKFSGISVSKNARGESIVTASSQKAAHIVNLIKKQKTKTKSHKPKAVTYSPRKHRRYATRNSSKTISACNSTPNMTALNQKVAKMNRYSATRDRPYNTRVSCTQVRYIPAGEENSDESFGCSPRENGNENPETNADLNYQCSEKEIIPTPVSNFPKLSSIVSENMPFLRSADSTAHGTPVSKSNNKRHYRTVSFTGDTLRCTVSTTSTATTNATTPLSSDSESVYTNDKEDTGECTSWDNGPSMFGYHLVGDDFFLQFAYECLLMDCEWDDWERLSCGMCISGQTIHDFHMQLRHEGFIQSRMILMLGAVDILQNRTLRGIIDDMTELLEEIVNSQAQSVVLLTLPFLKNAGMTNRKVLVFNEFLKTLGDGLVVHVLDAHPLFNNRNLSVQRTYDNCMNPKCYERITRNILCYPNGVVLWSHIGRSYIYNFLLQQLNDLLQNDY